MLTPAAARTWRTVPIGKVSQADGPWEVDWARAHADAARTLASIDFSKRDIYLWVQGTANNYVHPDFEAAVQAASMREGGASLTRLQHESSWHLRRSVPTGIATLKLVLEGIRQRLAQQGGEHRVLLAGESQGAWIVGEAIADPAFGSVVDRAVLMGHPSLAAHHYDAGQDPRVTVINHAGDQVAAPVNDPTTGLDAMIAIRTLDLGGIGDVVGAAVADPEQAVMVLKNAVLGLPFVKSFVRDPHMYGGEMTRAVEFLRTGVLQASEDELRAASLAARAALAPLPVAADSAGNQRLQRQALVAALCAA